MIPIYEAGEHDGQLYLAMRYVEGSDLKTVLEREGKLAPERALAILAQVAGALDAAHRRGLVHRDVKPANVLLDEDGHAYLTDFGITKQLGGASTDTGQMVGTLDYLAPEQIRGEPVDGRTDCYALGCVLYECLAGTPPFRRATEAETMWAHMQEQPPPLRGYPALDPVLRKALAKDQDERYASCAELIDAARAALGLARRRRAATRRAGRARRRRARDPRRRRCCVLAGSGRRRRRRAHRRRGLRARSRSGTASPRSTRRGESRLVHRAATRPGNVAVGEGAVWVLNTDDADRLAHRPRDRRRSPRRSRRGGVPSELAAGEGARLGRERRRRGRRQRHGQRVADRSATRARSRGPSKLPRRRRGRAADAGLPRIAVGAGAVWAINPDGSVSRIDPRPAGSSRGSTSTPGLDDRRRRRGRLVPQPRRPDRR